MIKFTIPGTPIGKPRMTRSDKWKKRPCVQRYWAWADKAREVAKPLIGSHVADDVAMLNWIAYFEPPKSYSKKKREEIIGSLYRGKPDRDNIDKAILDSLFDDDSGIAMGLIEKRWGSVARLEVSIVLND